MNDANDTDTLVDAIYAFIPKKLDDIVRNNREVARLALATDQEICDLYGPVTPALEKEVMDDWRFVSLNLITSDGLASVTLMFLLGFRRSSGNPRITSDVVRIDLDRGLVITRSGSLYKLGTKGEGEPPFEGLVMICSAFHDWGFGPAFGTPKICVDNQSD